MKCVVYVRTLIVSPTYQEAENIVEFLTLVTQHAPDADVLIVDDGSPDGTADLVADFAREHPRVSVLRRNSLDGLGAAYRAGFAVGLDPANGYEVLVHIDADLSHPAQMIPDLLGAIEGGADLAIASRYVAGGAVRNWSRRRVLLSRWGNRYSRLMLSIPIRDITAGFRAYRTDALRRVDPATTGADGYVFHTEMSVRSSDHGLRIVELPVCFVDRERGASKMSGSIIVESMRTVTRMGITRRWRRLTKRLARRSHTS